MAGKSAPPLETLFVDLDAAIKQQEFQRAIELSDRILAASADDTDALHCKIAAQIHSGKTSDALKTIEGAPAALRQRLQFEQAYCLYAARDKPSLMRALEVLDSCDNTSRKHHQLRSQVLYRLGKFTDSARALERVVAAEKPAVWSLEFLANLLAVYAAANEPGEGRRHIEACSQLLHRSYEALFNAGCLALGTGELGQAREWLEAALRLCRKAMAEDGATQDEIDQECCVISCQLAVAQHALGERDEAQATYTAISHMKAEIRDPGASAVATNNALLLTGDHHLFEFAKKLKAALGGVGKDKGQGGCSKLTDAQRHAMGINRAIVLLKMQKGKEAAALCEAMAEEFPDSPWPAIVRACVALRTRQIPQAKTELEAWKQKHTSPLPHAPPHPELSRALGCPSAAQPAEEAVALYLAQAALQGGDLDAVQAAVATLPPGPLSLRVSLWCFQQKNDVDGAVAFLEVKAEDAVKTMERESAGAFLKQAADWLGANGRAHQQAAFLRRLLGLQLAAPLRLSPRAIQPQLVIAMLAVDSKKAHELAKEFAFSTKIPLPAGLSATELENLSVSVVKRAKAAQTVAEIQKPTVLAPKEKMEANKERKRRKRKKRYPKNYDPSQPPPNPDKWLPRRERPGVKRRNKRAQAAAAMRQQGAPVSTSTSTSTSSAAATASDTAPKSQNQINKMKAQQKKKAAGKKKGKR